MSDPDILASLFLQRHLPEAAVVDDDDAVAVLSAMARRKSASILRLVSHERRSAILQKMSAPTRIQLEVILLQPMHRVGAWMESHPLTLPRESTVESARRRIQRHPSAPGEFYVVDNDGHLIGIVPLSRLFNAADSALIETVAQPAKGILRASETVDSALAHTAWHEVDTLPVVDRAEKLVGSIRHAALRMAATQPRDAEAGEDSGDYVLLANNLYVGLAEILATSISKTQDESTERAEGARQ